ncbi:ABC transporter ATP-binding protein [Paenibacillus crassostreae]|uniref:ABC transporter ATP-binding protein n=1 Tax=Paenibacillus crassostreae TaxID=1763538 RepID=A0A167FAV8_9BACL|nr:ABC transporter ATP-binding protein [Paenibacillus crassostreae]AOZ90869.1 hypothetical protein LPB68_00710 [Paenibacillus crassostreae]OAB76364.1 ABC transporter ATP-binding protein [Paenibacillus crassostreae]
MYSINNLNKHYSNGEISHQVLNDITVTIGTGEFLAILGPSGSGKSTFLNVLGGLDREFEGNVLFMGHDLGSYNEKQMVAFRRENIAFIFQEYHLLPTLTVYENVKVGQYLNKKNSSVDEILEKVGLKEHKHKFPNQLSGGQKQRVAIARALIKGPKVIFCDEPTGALDSSTAKMIMKLLLDLNKEHNVTVIMVTHNQELVKISNRYIRMMDGRILSTIHNKQTSDLDEIGW